MIHTHNGKVITHGEATDLLSDLTAILDYLKPRVSRYEIETVYEMSMGMVPESRITPELLRNMVDDLK